MFRVTKYRLYPTKSQEVLLAKHFGCVRWIYNWALAKKQKAWVEHKENLSRFDLQKQIPYLRKTEETKWLREVICQSLQHALLNLDTAYTKFFKKKEGFPRFKSKHCCKQSFQVPQRGLVGSSFVKIPKIGKINASVSRRVTGQVKTITISQIAGKYFAAVLSETSDAFPVGQTTTEAGTIGIDLGLKTFATLSTGEKIEAPKPLKANLKRLRRAQRKLSRKQKGGKNRAKQRLKVARIYEKISNIRNDFLHKLTTRLVRDSQTDTFAIEDLAVSNMVRNHKLARAISDAGWGTFRRFLGYKAERAGKNILAIGRFAPSSKQCSCGVKNEALTLADRRWTCTSCGQTHDRDILAAQNIKAFALHPRNKQSVPPVGREITPEEIAQ